MSATYAVVGATGNLGQEILNVLADREIDKADVAALASRRSQGVEVSYGDEIVKCQALEHFDFASVKIAFLAVGADVAKEWAPKIAAAGAVVVDASEAFRMEPQIPLVVPEVNAAALDKAGKKNIVALPCAATAQRLAALKPLHDEAGIVRIVSTTFQAVSEAGKDAMEELFHQTRAIFVGDSVDRAHFPKQIAFNVIPQIGEFEADGGTGEERRQVMETRKILSPDVKLSVTAVRAPVFVGNAEACAVEFERPLTPARAKALLREAPGIILIDRNEDGGYVTPTECVGDFATNVSRVRKDDTVAHGLSLWIVADNLRKSVALNAVQIAETLVAKHLAAPGKQKKKKAD